MNNVILLGNLCADPEVRVANSGQSVAKFRLAVRRSFKNAKGEYESDFISCLAFGTTAEFIRKYFVKGRKMLAQGSIQTRSWDKDDGTKGFSTDVIVNTAEFVDKAQECAGNPPPAQAKPQGSKNSYEQQGFLPVDDDQLPF